MSNQGKATTNELDDLHGLIARELARKIKTGEYTAADLNVARQFLKDNHVEQAALPGTPIHDLASTLPFAGADSYTQ